MLVQDDAVMRFIKYVGGAAPGSRWDVACDFKIQEEEEEEKEG